MNDWLRCRYIAEQALEDAVDSDIYMCGMQPINEGSPCHDIFQCDPFISCVAPVEADYYATKRSLMATKDYIRDMNLCALCAGMSEDIEGGKVDPLLKSVYATVLPICDTCKSRGGKALVGRHKHNGHAIQDRLEKQRRAKAVAARND